MIKPKVKKIEICQGEARLWLEKSLREGFDLSELNTEIGAGVMDIADQFVSKLNSTAPSLGGSGFNGLSGPRARRLPL